MRLALAAALAALLACRPVQAPAADPRPGSAGAAAQAAAPAGPRVTIDAPSGRSVTVAVELARTPAEQQRGLMHRERLAPGTGMLFLFPTTEERAFWMRNTLIPLDMIFIGEGLTVVGVLERAEPLTDVARTVGRPSRYVLEVPGGFAEAHGIRAGDAVRIEGLP